MTQFSLVFIGIAGKVVALDKGTGEEVWRATLKGYDFVNVSLQDGHLFAAANGELYCLAPTTGEIRWKNPLKGLGWGLITIAGADGQQSVLMRDKSQRDAAAATTTSVG